MPIILPNTTGMLSWAYQSTVLSNIKPKNTFLKTLFFGDRYETLPTEVAELSYKEGHTEMAPMVEVNAEAVPVKGNSVRFANVSCPNIRLKKPMEAFNVLMRRQPGTGVFITGGDVIQAARQAAIAEDLQTMNDMIERREEWMVSKMLTGTTSGYIELEYQVDERANWKVSIPRSTTMVASATAWSGSTAIELDFHNAKKAMAAYQGLIPNVCLLGATAAGEFITNAGVKALLNTRNVSAGVLTLQNQFDSAGAIYLGNFCGIDVWQYAGTYTSDAGVATAYIGAEQAIFLHTSPSNESKFLYGAIPDHEAFESGAFIGKTFGKSWLEKDPSVYVQLVHSRPIPLIRRPGAVYVLAT